MSAADMFEIYRGLDTLTLIFSSTMKNVDRACDVCLDFLSSLTEDYGEHLFAIHLVMREGLTNAVKHGNRLEPGKIVRCHMKIESGHLIYLEIEDQGEGFNWKKELTRQLDDNEDHGRGIKIIKEYFSKYMYNKAGNRLVLEKHLSK